jgi:hypothetical protein
VGAEVVHKQVMGIVNEEMESVEHLFVVAYQRHLEILIHNFSQL